MILTVPIIIIISIIILIIGTLGNIGGFGGGVLVVPILAVFFGFDLKIVIGTTLSALVLPAFIGAFKAWRRNEVDFLTGIMIEIPTMVGIAIGTSFSTILSNFTLQIIFGSIALIVSIVMIRRTILFYKYPEGRGTSKLWEWISSMPPKFVINRKDFSYTLSIPFAILSGLFIGVIAGLLGIGGGWLKAPIMVIGFGIPPLIASGTALFMILITSITGGYLHYLTGSWSLPVFLIITLNLSAGSLIGDRFKSRMNSSQIALIISISLALISIFTLIDAFIM